MIMVMSQIFVKQNRYWKNDLGLVSYPRIPFNGPDSEASFKAALTSSTVVGVSTSKTQSVRDALSSGTRTARPLSLPLSSGYISTMAVADPVDVGQRLSIPDRALRRSLFLVLGISIIV